MGFPVCLRGAAPQVRVRSNLHRIVLVLVLR